MTRPLAVTLSIVGTAVVSGITLLYLVIVVAITYIDTHFHMNSLGWTLIWMAIIGVPLSIAALIAAALSGVSPIARGFAAAATVLTVLLLVGLVVAYLGMTSQYNIDDGALFFVAWFVPALLAIGGVATLVSYGFGWHYFRERAAARR
ncbi:hypothetical protein [Gordonia araii]|uniref:hypothetical protein n=1 Tax=Gordonia araii TaxID=263909 RepID=UPI0003122CCC|nr:hypothetical protein [Gordonia araii]NNG96970.1 hypothetical protein [Gordonia araii NBRC 100433]